MLGKHQTQNSAKQASEEAGISRHHRNSNSGIGSSLKDFSCTQKLASNPSSISFVTVGKLLKLSEPPSPPP